MCTSEQALYNALEEEYIEGYDQAVARFREVLAEHGALTEDGSLRITGNNLWLAVAAFITEHEEIIEDEQSS